MNPRRSSYDLFSAIRFANKEVSMNSAIDSRLSQVPLCQIVENLRKERRPFHLFFYGNASLGKSTQMTALRLHLIKEKIPFVYQDLKLLNSGSNELIEAFRGNVENFFAALKSDEERLSKGGIILLDSYDELEHIQMKLYIDQFLEESENLWSKSNLSLLVACRCSVNLEDNFERGKFSEFLRAQLLWLSNEQVNLILRKELSSSDFEVVKTNKHYDLLRTPMFFRIFLDLIESATDENKKDEIIKNYSNETWFFEQYFNKLYSIKKPSDRSSQECENELIKIGKACYLNKISDLYISTVLGDIFYVYKDHLQAKHELFKPYVKAKYLYDTLKSHYDIFSLTVLEEIFSKSDYLTIYYLGQILQQNKQNELFVFLTENNLIGDLLGEFCLGYNDNVIDNKIQEYMTYASMIQPLVVDKIREVRWEGAFPQEAWRLLCGQQIRIIEIKNDPIYFTVGNCVIDKGTKALLMGCMGTMIPSDTVVSIGSCAFQNQLIESLIIPKGVKEIRFLAIGNCRLLKRIVIGPDVENIAENAIERCFALEQIEVSPENKFYRAVNGCLIELRTKKLVLCLSNGIIPNDDSIEILGEGAFENYDNIYKKLELPNSLCRIENKDFSSWGQYKFLTKYENGFRYIGNQYNPYLVLDGRDNQTSEYGTISNFTKILNWLPKIKDIAIPKNVVHISEEAIECNQGTILFGNAEIPERIFGADGLMRPRYRPNRIVIGRYVHYIDRDAFEGCIGTKISLPKQFENLKEHFESQGLIVEIRMF